MNPDTPWQRAQESLDLLTGLAQLAQDLQAVDRTREASALTVVGGFLGAGKTTLMRHVLTAPHGLKVAAVVNDVAALNVDASWVKSVHQDTLELSNGCVCCSSSGQLARSLLALSERSPRPDVILLETSGVSSLRAIAQMLAVVPGIRLDCTVCVVDASAADMPHALQDFQDAQVAAADLVLLNKCDLSTSAQIQGWKARVARLAPRAHVLQTHNAAVPAPLLFHAAHPQREPAWGQGGDGVPAFDTAVLRASGALAQAQMAQALSDLPAAIMRCKGWVWLDAEPMQAQAVQAVGPRWAWQPQAEAPPHSCLVCIGLAKDDVARVATAHFAPLGFVLDTEAKAQTALVA